MRDELNETSARAALLEIARGVLDGTVDVISAARAVARLRLTSDDPDNPVFNVFITIDSETDHLSGGESRANYSPEWIRECEREAEETAAFYRDDVLAACHRLVLSLSNS